MMNTRFKILDDWLPERLALNLERADADGWTLVQVWSVHDPNGGSTVHQLRHFALLTGIAEIVGRRES